MQTETPEDPLLEDMDVFSSLEGEGEGDYEPKQTMLEHPG
jgi:hypothetical protein